MKDVIKHWLLMKIAELKNEAINESRLSIDSITVMPNGHLTVYFIFDELYVHANLIMDFSKTFMDQVSVVDDDVPLLPQM